MARRAEHALRVELRRLTRENARLREHLRDISARCRGMAVGIASQALNSDQWPVTTPAGKTHDE